LTPGKTTSLAFAVGGHGDLQGEVSLRFPFNAPGYLIEAVAADSGIAFDVVRCPIANYFSGQGAVDLCSASLVREPSISVRRPGATLTMRLPS
jgi:hypothetical protein